MRKDKAIINLDSQKIEELYPYSMIINYLWESKCS